MEYSLLRVLRESYGPQTVQSVMSIIHSATIYTYYFGNTQNTSRFSNSSAYLLCLDSVPVGVPTRLLSSRPMTQAVDYCLFFQIPAEKLRSVVSIQLWAANPIASAHQNSNAVLNILPRKKHFWFCLVAGSLLNYL